MNTLTQLVAETGRRSVNEVVLRIAGNSQDGIQVIGTLLARLAGRSDQEVMTFMTIPSTISGGPSIYQVRIGSGEILSPGDEADVLLCFYQHSYEGHIRSLKKGGLVVYDSSHVTPNPEWQKDHRHIGIPISSLTIEVLGGTARDRGKNVFALGLVAKMFDLNATKLEILIGERFASKDPSILPNALMAFHAGYAQPLDGTDAIFRFTDPARIPGPQVVMNGNEALALGLIAGGVRFGAGYPITPWSDVMELLRRELPKYGGLFIQCEDEIAAVSMALGASYADRVAVTGSSGPGIALKSEAIGWGVMAEIPLVVVDVQRGGPSTGMPTNVEQSDLNIAINGGHGDSPRVVIAAANVEDCFYTAIEAVNIARKFSVPVFILSDQSIATRIEAFPEPDVKKLCQDISPDLRPVADHKPYDLSAPDHVAHHIVPGTRIMSGKYPIATGLEHDEMGQPTSSPKLHDQMTSKRSKKLEVLARELPTPEVHGEAEEHVLVIGWGSTKGAILEAVQRAQAQGQSVSALHIRHINPLPANLGKTLRRFNHLVVVEMNHSGQLARLLRAEFPAACISSITKSDSTAFRVQEILDRLAQLDLHHPSVLRAVA